MVFNVLTFAPSLGRFKYLSLQPQFTSIFLRNCRMLVAEKPYLIPIVKFLTKPKIVNKTFQWL